MKKASKVVFCLFFALTYMAQMLELANTMAFMSHLDDVENRSVG